MRCCFYKKLKLANSIILWQNRWKQLGYGTNTQRTQTDFLSDIAPKKIGENIQILSAFFSAHDPIFYRIKVVG